jgi:hypothetical protein
MSDQQEARTLSPQEVKVAKADLTAEQRDHLERHVAGIGPNQGPALLKHSERILEHAARHHRLKDELTGIRVMLDMLRSEIAGDYDLPATTIGYVSAGLVLVATITGAGIATQPFSALLLDAPVGRLYHRRVTRRGRRICRLAHCARPVVSTDQAGIIRGSGQITSRAVHKHVVTSAYALPAASGPHQPVTIGSGDQRLAEEGRWRNGCPPCRTLCGPRSGSCSHRPLGAEAVIACAAGVRSVWIP